jgi:hypothetical protein
LEEEESEVRYEEMVRKSEGKLGDKLKASAWVGGLGMGLGRVVGRMIRLRIR